MVPKTIYQSYQSPSSTTTPTSITSTNYYQSLSTFTNQFLTTSTVDLAITMLQQIELITGLPSIWKERYKNFDRIRETSAVNLLVDVWGETFILADMTITYQKIPRQLTYYCAR